MLGEREGVLYAGYPYPKYANGNISDIYIEANSYSQDDLMYAGSYPGLNVGM